MGTRNARSIHSQIAVSAHSHRRTQCVERSTAHSRSDEMTGGDLLFDRWFRFLAAGAYAHHVDRISLRYEAIGEPVRLGHLAQLLLIQIVDRFAASADHV